MRVFASVQTESITGKFIHQIFKAPRQFVNTSPIKALEKNVFDR